jgi:hypothetical protein
MIPVINLEYTRVRADSTPDDEEDVRMLLS